MDKILSTFGLGKGSDDEKEKAELLERKPNQKETVELVIFLRDRAGIFFHLEDGNVARADELLDLVIEEQGLPPDAKEVFSLWFVSPILDIRLKAHHQPFQIVQHWDQLCALYTDADNKEIHDSEPVLMVQRDVFYPKEQEVSITNEQMLCLLYHEAKFNVVQGRYALYMEDYHRLAGLQALIHLGRFSRQSVQADYRASLVQFYPEHMYVMERFLFFSPSRQPARQCEELFMEAHRQVSEQFADLDVDKSLGILYRKYLEICWAYPFYGSAFFSGQTETPAGRVRKFVSPPADTELWVAINLDCISIIDKERCELLLSIPFTHTLWDFQDPEFDGDNDPPPCIFLQFLAPDPQTGLTPNAYGNQVGVDPEEGGAAGLTKLLKIISREGKLMDALINTCVRRKLYQRQRNPGIDFVETGVFESSTHSVLNKLERFCLTTYTQDGEKLEPQAEK